MNTIPKIIIDNDSYIASNKLRHKVAIVTGGDSGIGAATAIAYAKEGATVAINYLNEDKDAQYVSKKIKKYGARCLLLKGDVGDKEVCNELIAQVIEKFGRLDIVINNAGTQVQQEDLRAISTQQLENTFRTNIFSMFYVTQAALPHLQPGGIIINTTSVTAYRGSQELLDYSSTKGAIVSFTRSLSKNLARIPIRVNAVAPGPVWTPLVITSFDEKKLEEFGKQQPLGRAAQPYELAPVYVFLASEDSSYITGQVIHVNGGEIVNA